MKLFHKGREYSKVRTSGVCLFHDNARPYIIRRTIELLEGFVSDVSIHPPYNPDSALFNYHLFTKLKETLGEERRKNDVEDVKLAVSNLREGRGARVLQGGNTRVTVRKVY